MKKVIIITALITLVVVFGGYKMVKVTGDYPFCGSCHAWDGEIALTAVADSVHGRANPNGTHATCTDCHLPHDGIFGYLSTKAKNGISEGYTALFADPSKKDWINNRANARTKHTYDSACLNCHSTIDTIKKPDSTIASERMHSKYVELKNSADRLKCTDCHKHVGHKDLGKMLIEQKHNVADSWEEWKKANSVKE